MSNRFNLPLIDVASVVVAPVLVMGMVGSLCFFLIEVLQGGQFEGRLQYTFFFFVLATVLIARISITQSGNKAAIYGALLAGASFIAMLAFVQYTSPLFKALGPLLNLVIMGIVWWSAHKLTWDCTHFEQSHKASGRGVLAAAGFDRTKATTSTEDEVEYDFSMDRSRQAYKQLPKGRKADFDPDTALGWFDRYKQFKEWRKKKPHTPGVWVLYFALAALPLFALGQAMIPATDEARRASTFWQMAVYIASALGLLMTTTLMGLRRYLEDRKATIPTAMTGAWLGLGAILVVLFVAVGAVLPRPHSETPLINFSGKRQDRNASDYAQVRDNSAGKGEGQQGQKKEAGEGKSTAKGGKTGGQGQGQSSSGQGGEKQGNTKGGSQSKNGNDSGKQNNTKQDNNGNNKSNANDKNGEKSGKQGEQNSSNSNSQQNSQDQADKSKGESSSNSNSSEGLKKLTEAAGAIGNVVKLIVWIVLIVAVLVGGFYFVVKHLANFTGWAKSLLDWWRNLFKKPIAKRANGVVTSAAEEEVIERPPPFTEFRNPFQDGTAETRPLRAVVRYSFTALDAWAWDHLGQGRTADETPAEFVARLAEDYPSLEHAARAVANAHIRAEFSESDLPKNTSKVLAELWATLERTAPLSRHGS
jgi:hypothetical protein